VDETNVDWSGRGYWEWKVLVLVAGLLEEPSRLESEAGVDPSAATEATEAKEKREDGEENSTFSHSLFAPFSNVSKEQTSKTMLLRLLPI
jgi:hypothetical protein